MKKLLFLILMYTQTANAQQLALLDRNLRDPFLLRDTFTLQDVATGFFPLYIEDIPAVVEQLENFAQQLAAPDAVQEPAGNFSAPHVHLFLQRRNNLYSCVLQSTNKQFSVPWIIGQGGRKGTLREISRFLEYLRQNSAVALAAQE